MKTNHAIKTLTAALLLAAAPSATHAASLLADGNFDNLPVGTAPDVNAPAGRWFWPADYMDATELSVSQVSIAPAPPGGTGNALRLSFGATENIGLNMHLPNLLARSVTKASGEIITVSFDIYVSPGRGGGSIHLGKGRFSDEPDRGPQLQWHPNGQLYSRNSSAVDTALVSYPRGVWQTIRLEVDVAREQFNFYWSEKGQPISVTRSNLGFCTAGVPYIDRFHIARFSDPADWADAESYFDNIQVSAGAPAAVVPSQSFVPPGGNVTLSVTNTLGVPSTYQWRFNGTNLPGATSSTLALSNVSTNQSGSYSVIVSNEYEVVTATAAVQVVTRVAITSQPKSVSVLPGTNFTLSAAALSPLSPISYQWQCNGTNLPGATHATLTLTNAQFDLHTGYYRVLASDPASTALSDPASVVVLARPVIVSPPVATTVLQGGTAVFSIVGAPDHPLLPLTYRWLRNGTTFLSNGPPTLVVTNCQTSANFRCQLINAAGSIASAQVSLTVLPDNDRDGMADDWEILNGFDTNTVADAALDSDGDGMRNRDEYAAGTNPRDPTSRLKIESLTRTGTNAVVLQFQTVSNRTYTVQFSGEATGAVWTNLAHFNARTTNATEWLTNSLPRNVARGFYRVVTPRQP